MEISADVEKWMQKHTIADLRTIAFDCRSDDQKISDINNFIDDLTRMARKTGLINFSK